MVLVAILASVEISVFEAIAHNPVGRVTSGITDLHGIVDRRVGFIGIGLNQVDSFRL